MTNRTTTANEIADYIIWSAHESGSFMSNLKLQKLLYYVQAWHLAIFQRRLFAEKFHAWIHGPVIPAVYYRFNSYRWHNIEEDVKKPDLDQGTIAFIEEVLEEYGPLDARRLEYLSHREDPWIEARKGIPDDEPCTMAIDEKLMELYYRRRLSDAEIEALLQNEEEIDRTDNDTITQRSEDVGQG